MLKWKSKGEWTQTNEAAREVATLGLIIAFGMALSLPRVAVADDVYDGSDSSTSDRPYVDGEDWFNPQNWDNAAAVPVSNLLPTDIASVTAATGFIASADPTLTIDGNPLIDTITDGEGNPVQGAVFDPVG